MKEVLQSLVDDGLVSADKIGSSNCESVYTSQSTHLIPGSFSLLELSISARSNCWSVHIWTAAQLKLRAVGSKSTGYHQSDQ